MRNFIHGKKDPGAEAPEPADTTAMSAESAADDAAAQISDEVLSAEDVETEKLKNAIAQVMAEETAVLPHIEQLSSSVTKESGLDTDNTAAPSDDDTDDDASDGKGTKEGRKKKSKETPAVPDAQASISSWFVTFMAMKIPIAGWIYLLYLAFSKKTVNRRNFARAYLLIKLVFLVLGLIILLILISVAMNFLQDLLDYMAML